MAAEIKITISSTSSGGAIQQATKDVEGLGKTAKDAGGGFSALKEIGVGALREIGSIAVNALGSAAGAVKDFIADGVSAARETAKLNAQTEAVLKSTGNAAGTSAQHISEYASALSDAAGKSLFGDDQIQQSENMLLTFTNIKGATLDAATAISVDMAQALGGAPKDNAIQLGKALNDPVKGVTALTRVGVTFSQDQKDMIQAMVDTGDVAGAQAVILAELNKEFGGSAEAAAKADGGMAQFQARMGEAAESIGKAVLPLLGQLAGFLNDTVAPILENVVVPAVGDLIAALTAPDAGTAFDALSNILPPDVAAAIVDTITTVQTIISSLIDTLTAPDAGTAFDALSNILPPEIAAVIVDSISMVKDAFANAETPVQGFINVVSQISPIFGSILSIAQQVFPQLQALVQTVLTTIIGYFQQHGADMLAQFQQTWTTLQATLQALVVPIVAIIQAFLAQIMAFWQAHGQEIMTFVGYVWDQINQIIQIALELIQATIVPLLQGIADFISAHGTEIQTILTAVWNAIKSIITIAITLIKGILQTALQLIRGDWEGAWNTIKTTGSTIWDNIKVLFQNLLTILQTEWKLAWDLIYRTFQGILDSIVNWVKLTFQSIVGAIRGFADQAASAAAGVANAIVNGITGGIEDGASKIISAAKSAAMAALDAAKKALGISSPSKLFARQVGLPMAQGMAHGLVSGAPLVAAATQSVAGAAVSGATYNSSSFAYNPTIYTTAQPNDLDGALYASLAGV